VRAGSRDIGFPAAVRPWGGGSLGLIFCSGFYKRGLVRAGSRDIGFPSPVRPLKMRYAIV